MELTSQDAKLLSAAITYLLSIAHSGETGAKALALVAMEDKATKNKLRAATLALSGDDKYDFDTFTASLIRLEEIYKGLNNIKPESVQVVEPVSGDVATGPKTYSLRLTHDELHLVSWAVSFAEAGIRRDPLEMLKAISTYANAREGIDSFVDKFNQTHEVARQEDGEGNANATEQAGEGF